MTVVRVPEIALDLRGGGLNIQVLIAQLLGWGVTAAALTLYTPIITELLQKREEVAAKMSTTSWALQAFCFAIFSVYHVRSGYPLSTFLDFVALGIQSTAILGLASVYNKRFDAFACLPALGLLAALFAPMGALANLQVVAALIMSFALVPQVVRNFRGKSRGGWSPVSAGLSVSGNAMRVFTTLTLADANPRLLFQFSVSVLFCSIIFVQSLVWQS